MAMLSVSADPVVRRDGDSEDIKPSKYELLIEDYFSSLDFELNELNGTMKNIEVDLATNGETLASTSRTDTSNFQISHDVNEDYFETKSKSTAMRPEISDQSPQQSELDCSKSAKDKKSRLEEDFDVFSYFEQMYSESMEGCEPTAEISTDDKDFDCEVLSSSGLNTPEIHGKRCDECEDDFFWPSSCHTCIFTLHNVRILGGERLGSCLHSPCLVCICIQCHGKSFSSEVELALHFYQENIDNTQHHVDKRLMEFFEKIYSTSKRANGINCRICKTYFPKYGLKVHHERWHMDLATVAEDSEEALNIEIVNSSSLKGDTSVSSLEIGHKNKQYSLAAQTKRHERDSNLNSPRAKKQKRNTQIDVSCQRKYNNDGIPMYHQKIFNCPKCDFKSTEIELKLHDERWHKTGIFVPVISGVNHDKPENEDNVGVVNVKTENMTIEADPSCLMRINEDHLDESVIVKQENPIADPDEFFRSLYLQEMGEAADVAEDTSGDLIEAELALESLEKVLEDERKAVKEACLTCWDDFFWPDRRDNKSLGVFASIPHHCRFTHHGARVLAGRPVPPLPCLAGQPCHICTEAEDIERNRQILAENKARTVRRYEEDYISIKCRRCIETFNSQQELIHHRRTQYCRKKKYRRCEKNSNSEKTSNQDDGDIQLIGDSYTDNIVLEGCAVTEELTVDVDPTLLFPQEEMVELEEAAEELKVENNFRCQHCERKFSLRKQLFDHRKRCKKSKQAAQEISLCDVGTDDVTVKGTGQAVTELMTGDLVRCEECGGQFSDEEQWEQHRRARGGRYPCIECHNGLNGARLVFRSMCEFRAHARSHLSCRACGTQYDEPGQLVQHREAPTHPLQCFKCEAELDFGSLCEFQQHIEQHIEAEQLGDGRDDPVIVIDD